jgi:hypothetical protein
LSGNEYYTEGAQDDKMANKAGALQNKKDMGYCRKDVSADRITLGIAP